jgi:hypothetical protein
MDNEALLEKLLQIKTDIEGAQNALETTDVDPDTLDSLVAAQHSMDQAYTRLHDLRVELGSQEED